MVMTEANEVSFSRPISELESGGIEIRAACGKTT